MRDINLLYSQQTYQQIMQDIPNYKSYDNLLYKMRDIIEQFSYELKDEVIDILSRIFPSFALQDTDSKYTKYDEISEYKWENDQENNWQVDSWERVLSQLCMLLDVDETQAINEFSLTRLYKEFFCIVCQVYDCQIHGLNDVSTLQTSYIQSQQKFSDFDKSMIQLGIQNFSYDPCRIWLNNYQNLTCQSVFLYLFEELEINKGIYLDQIQLYEAKIQQHGKEHFKKKVQKKSLYGIGNKYGAIDPVLGYTYQPCMHYSHDGKLVPEEEQKCKQCICAKRKFCDKYCMCDPQKCTIRRKGCSCTSNCKNKKCDCYAGGFECDPDVIKYKLL
ncbi:hypothetical protein PPERSA_11347 [Pseudocohnilembus persalinus]|uniref:CXC domain-containing protein n=1 Tax=Pseudocohnilembus persalinus TaxID=266149 RepID=A0A0V0QPD4_PSEPJ|nr:hypothetical protein PPERSA_11347 [Pseudocohnilembus persalinus]|eukprot:KRX04223.1 hypothetical protein PPERSA_11347 [Pseudocohnilembus persalinus]